MAGFDIKTASDVKLGIDTVRAVYLGSTRIWPETYTYSSDYFTIESLEDGNDIAFDDAISQNGYNIYYSLDEGLTWSSYNPLTTGTYITLNNEDKMLVKSTVSNINYSIISSKTFKVYGNLHSLIYGGDFKHMNSLPSNFSSPQILKGTNVVDASGLVLPATILTKSCYASMFNGCTSLTAPPKLPAMTMTNNCYSHMFYRCSSLTYTPELPADTLAPSCYSDMFYRCTSLTDAAMLPARTCERECYASMFLGCSSLASGPTILANVLAISCCDSMFANCTSISVAPKLRATTLVDYCYAGMFAGCTSLRVIHCNATNYNATYTEGWVEDVYATGSFYKNSRMTGWPRGINGIPTGWTLYNEST